jgi:hypothetical protein
MRQSAIFYKSFYDAIKELEPAQQGEVYNAIFEFTFNEVEPELTGFSKVVFTLIKPQLIANQKRYESGTKGGRPPKDNQTETETKPNNNQIETNPEPNKNENENANENENENANGKSKPKKFDPPTKEDVINYFLENGYSTELAIKVFNYYSVHNWHDSKGNAVKNWKQKMIAVWFKPENKKEAEPFIPKYKNLHDDPTYNLALKQ